MKKEYIIKALKYLIISILMFGLLTYLNLQTGYESKKLTNTIYLKIFHLKLEHYLIVRKSLHFMYYFVYGYFVFQTIYNYYKLKSEFKRYMQNKVYILYIIIMGILSVYCEFLQMYAVDRTPSIIDIQINFGGSLLMLICIHLVFILKRKYFKKKN